MQVNQFLCVVSMAAIGEYEVIRGELDSERKLREEAEKFAIKVSCSISNNCEDLQKVTYYRAYNIQMLIICR